jgi:hypothetical protein
MSLVQLQAPSQFYGSKVNLSAGRSYVVPGDGLLWADSRAINELLQLGFWPAPSSTVDTEDDLLGNFSFGDASPHLIGVIKQGRYNPVARIDITQPFNGLSAQVSIGTLVDPDLIMPASGCSPYDVAVYQASPALEVANDTAVYLFIQSGVGSSQGSGRFWLQLV